MERLTTFSCMVITALDIDAMRLDKSLQVTLDALSIWSNGTRECAVGLGKENFYIAGRCFFCVVAFHFLNTSLGEVTDGDTFGSLYL